MSSSGIASSSDDPRWPGPVLCVVMPPELSGRPGRYAPHVVIVIVVVVVAAVIGPPGQVEAALFALAALLPFLGASRQARA